MISTASAHALIAGAGAAVTAATALAVGAAARRAPRRPRLVEAVPEPTSNVAFPEAAPRTPSCRSCGAGLARPFLDLGMSPLANSYLRPQDLGSAESFYPLQVHVCERCWLVQLDEFETPATIFTDYAYFSSYSASWLAHARQYAEAIAGRLALDGSSLVVEVASNDGYLLRNFRERGIPVLGIEPARNVAKVAIEAGIPTVTRFFGVETARALVAEGKRADLLIGNNVLAHVPDLNDFVGGLGTLLAPAGLVTMEFPHLLRLMAEGQFDTVYHEHFSYFSLLAVERVFARHGLTIFDVEELTTHGGSLRIHARHAADPAAEPSERLRDLRAREIAAGLERRETYDAFGTRVVETRLALLEFLIGARRAGKTVVGYGAPAKGNTLLNFSGVRDDLVRFTVDRSPHKHGTYLPGTHIPVHHPDRIFEERPDYVLILPWNLKDEIMHQMAGIKAWGGRFVVPIPEVRVY